MEAGALRNLDHARARFDGATSIFDRAMLELEEEGTRLRAEAAAEKEEFANRLAAARDDFAPQIAEAKADPRRLVEHLNEAELIRSRAEQALAYAASRLSQRRRIDPKTRLRNYIQFPSKTRDDVEIIGDSVFFDRDYYVRTNPDVVAAGTDPALHYLLHGWSEGRDPGPFFSTNGYLARYPDVAGSSLNPLLHYETFGRIENRKPY